MNYKCGGMKEELVRWRNWEIWQNLEKKRNTDHDFPPPLYVGGK